METIAVYWEAKPKTYGFQETAHLSLLNIVIRPEQMAEWGLWLLKLADLDIGFHLVLAKYSNDHALRLYVLLEEPWGHRVASLIDGQIQPGFEKDFSWTFPVELISFQGPHFGDRYGIADAAFKALESQKIPVLVAACSGATVYIVLPENMLPEARAALAEAFTVP